MTYTAKRHLPDLPGRVGAWLPQLGGVGLHREMVREARRKHGVVAPPKLAAPAGRSTGRRPPNPLLVEAFVLRDNAITAVGVVEARRAAMATRDAHAGPRGLQCPCIVCAFPCMRRPAAWRGGVAQRRGVAAWPGDGERQTSVFPSIRLRTAACSSGCGGGQALGQAGAWRGWPRWPGLIDVLSGLKEAPSSRCRAAQIPANFRRGPPGRTSCRTVPAPS